MDAKRKKICQLPDDIIFTEILSRVPVKFLGRSKCVSKSWRNFIKDDAFHGDILHKNKPQWICMPPPKCDVPLCLLNKNDYNEVNEDIDMDIHVYSVDDSGVSTVVEKYEPPSDLVYMKYYDGGLICCYHGSLRLTVFSTITQESATASLPLPITSEQNEWRRRVFEYGLDPLSKKYKVLTYTMIHRYDGREFLKVSDFQVLTLGGENPTWRPIKKLSDKKHLPKCVTIVNGTLYWYVELQKDKYSRRWVFAPHIVSFSFATEKFAIIENLGVNEYFEHPLFEFEGSLCLVEISSDVQEEEECLLKLNVWMLKDNSVLVPRLKNITMSLHRTNFWTRKITYTAKYENIFHISMRSAEFSTQNGKLLMIARDYEENYIFSYGFLNSQCSRMKIVGQPLRHPTMQQCMDIWKEEQD